MRSFALPELPVTRDRSVRGPTGAAASGDTPSAIKPEDELPIQQCRLYVLHKVMERTLCASVIDRGHHRAVSLLSLQH